MSNVELEAQLLSVVGVRSFLCLHFPGKVMKQVPVGFVQGQIGPELLALLALDRVVAEHVVGQFRPDEAGVDLQRHLFQQTDEIPLVLCIYFGQPRIIGRTSGSRFP